MTMAVLGLVGTLIVGTSVAQSALDKCRPENIGTSVALAEWGLSGRGTVEANIDLQKLGLVWPFQSWG